jgi:hypothetical protein
VDERVEIGERHTREGAPHGETLSLEPGRCGGDRTNGTVPCAAGDNSEAGECQGVGLYGRHQQDFSENVTFVVTRYWSTALVTQSFAP